MHDPEIHGENLAALLHRTSRLTLVLEALGALAIGAAVLLLVGLLAVVCDALFPLASWGLVAVDLVMAGLAAVALAFAAWQVQRNLYRPDRAARLIEMRLGLADNRLINAIQLHAASRSSASSELVRKAVDKGETLARSLSSLDVADFGRFYRASAVTAAVVVVLGLSMVASPRLFAMVLSRYFDPHGDHPPYTRVEFEVATTPEPIYFGHSATITAKLSGPHDVSQANVVFRDSKSRETLPMVRDGDGRFVLPIDRATDSRVFYIETPEGRSRSFDLTVLQIPYFEAAHVTYRFPPYTNWPESRHALDSRGMRALVGTEITVTAQGSLPLTCGILELQPGDEQPETLHEPATVQLSPHPDDPATVSGSFPLEYNGQYRLRLVGADGAESIDMLEGRLIAAPDRPPRVAIVEPGPQLVAVEGWHVPVQVQASDDIGLARMQILTSVNGWGPWAAELEMERPQPNLGRGRYEFRLDDLGARAGDVISYYAAVSDSFPGGTQLAESPTHRIHVISESEYQDFMRHRYRMEELIAESESYGRQLDALKERREELLEQMEPLLEKLEAGEELTTQEQQQLEQLQQKLAEFAQQAERLAAAFRDRAAEPPLYDLEQPYQQMLERLSKQLQEQASDADQAAEEIAESRSRPGAAGQQDEMCKACRRFAENSAPFDSETGQQLAQGQKDMELVRKADQILGAAERLRAVIVEQRDLTDRLAEFRDAQPISAADQPRADGLGQRQQQLREELESAVRQLEESAERARQELPQMAGDAAGLCQSVRDMQIADDQQQAAGEARHGRGTDAHAAAESAARKLESLQSESCNSQGAANELAGNLDGPLKLPKESLRRSLEQLAQGRELPSLESPSTGQSGSQGRSGTRFGESMSRMVVVGPRQQEDTQTDGRQLQAGQRGDGPGAFELDSGDGAAAEVINPDARHSQRSTAGNLRGVPVPYREQAEAYFRRIANEQ